jgi:hypothetical protein
LADACHPKRGCIEWATPAAVQQHAIDGHGRDCGHAVANGILTAFMRGTALPKVIDLHLAARTGYGVDKADNFFAHRTAGCEHLNASLDDCHDQTSFAPPSS